MSMPGFIIIPDTPSANENGIAVVCLKKTPQVLTNLHLVRGDSRTQIIRMILQRYIAGVDMSSLTYYVNAINAEGVGDVYSTSVEKTFDDHSVMLAWTVYGIATAAPGTTRFEVEAIDEDDGEAVVWQSGTMSFQVIDDLGDIPTEEQEQQLSDLQNLILYVDRELPGILRMAEDMAEAEAERKRAEEERVAAERQREIDFETLSHGITVVNGTLCVKYDAGDEPEEDENDTHPE